MPLSFVVNREHHTFNPLQPHLFRQGRKKLNKKTLSGIRQHLLPSDSYVSVYWQNYYALFRPLEIVELVATLCEEARNKHTLEVPTYPS